jgi:phosphoglycolate phosphatase-like HAD superfamily hydrolase
MINTILFDFDGVILDSMPTRAYGFKKIFENFDHVVVDKLLEFHNANGGLSRYIKIKYFYEKLLLKTISENEIHTLAERFSTIMRHELINKKYLIQETINFIQKNYTQYNLHIVSGSDEKELRYLCRKLELEKYFKSIHGSPTPKNTLVANVLQSNDYKENETILIGDSINDYEATQINKIRFYGYNNIELKSLSENYLENYMDLYK